MPSYQDDEQWLDKAQIAQKLAQLQLEQITPKLQWDYSLHQWANTKHPCAEKMTTTKQKLTLMSQQQQECRVYMN